MVADLRAESADLDSLVAGLPPEQWARETPAAGWTIAHQIAHLLWTDRVALLSVTDEPGFAAVVATSIENTAGFVDAAAEELAVMPPGDLLAEWRATRESLHDALLTVDQGRKLPWFGPPMRAASMATARLMETWAHGLDVADALGLDPEPTPRLRHVAHLGVRTRGFAYLVRGLDPPEAPVRVELTGPGGELWTWGPDDADQRVLGPALDFCLLVTQRRHADDLALVAVGADAEHWLTIAQAFAGPPGVGRAPRATT